MHQTLSATQSSRREFLAGAGAGTGLIAGSSIANAAHALTLNEPHLPGISELWSDILFMNSLGNRYPGSPAHARFCMFLDERFSAAGLTVDRLERQDAVHWEPFNYSIKTADGRNIEVSSPNRESASTGPEGVTAPLKYCGLAKGTVFAAGLDPDNVPRIAIPTDVAGKIALIEIEVEKLPYGKMFTGNSLVAVVDPTNAGGLPEVQATATAWNNVEKRLPATLEADLRKAGALGVIYAWVNGADADGKGQIRRNGTDALPSLWVSVSGAKELRELEAKGTPVTLTIQARVTRGVKTATTLATLPGSSDETILLWTNTDGMNAIQENGSIAIINLMKYFARIPRSERKRTITCVMSEGHLALNHTPDVWWTTQRPEVLERAVASLSMEHMGCHEWVGNPQENSFESTGKPDISWAFTFADQNKPNYMAHVMQEALKESRLARTVVTNCSEYSFSPGLHPWQVAKVPSIGYISTPAYFLAEGPNGHLDKICPDLYYDQFKTMARAIHLLDAAPRRALRQS